MLRWQSPRAPSRSRVGHVLLVTLTLAACDDPEKKEQGVDPVEARDAAAPDGSRDAAARDAEATRDAAPGDGSAPDRVVDAAADAARGDASGEDAPAVDAALRDAAAADASHQDAAVRDAAVADSASKDAAPKDAAPEPPPPDIDCNPTTDVNVPCSTLEDGTRVSWPAGTAMGPCRYGKRSCNAGVWGTCIGTVPPSAADRCDVPSDDSNCNGVFGEGCDCTDGTTRACGSDVGSCQRGVQMCVGGKWSPACVGAIEKAARDTCEPGNDDDCSGTANEGCACLNGAVETCGRVHPSLGDCVDRQVTCTQGAWPADACRATCNDCPAGACSPGACIDGVNTYSCNCPDGYSGQGTQRCVVEDKDDCPDSKPCAPGTCVDGDGTFTCECPADHMGDGTKSCAPIDDGCTGERMNEDWACGVCSECVSPDGNFFSESCSAQSGGGRACISGAWWALEARARCIDFECAFKCPNPDPCGAGARCVENPSLSTGWECDCLRGEYDLDRGRCGCTGVDCGPNKSCYETSDPSPEGALLCECAAGFEPGSDDPSTCVPASDGS
jgi:hypothetical protein